VAWGLVQALIALCSVSVVADIGLDAPEYGSCGWVSIGGYVTGDPDHLTWDWGDGTDSTSWFPATHMYGANDVYTVTVTASPSGETAQTFVTVTNAEDPPCLGTGTVIAFVESSLLPALRDCLDTLRTDMERQGFSYLEQVIAADTSPSVIRTTLQQYWSTLGDLVGALLIGDIRAAYAEIHTGDFSDPQCQEVFISLDAVDMYYMDLDGQWEHVVSPVFCGDAPPNVCQCTEYDSVASFAGEYIVSPDDSKVWDIEQIENKTQYEAEIWVGRIMGHNLDIPGKTETQILSEYFAWNHRFRREYPGIPSKAFEVVAHHSCSNCDAGMDWGDVFDAMDLTLFSTEQQYNSRLQDAAGSRLFYVGAHSYPKGHWWENGDQWTHSDELKAMSANSVFYILNACSSCRWDEYKVDPNPDYLGGLYVFPKTHVEGDYGISAIGFAGVGGFNHLEILSDYLEVRPNAPYGTAWKYYFNENLGRIFQVWNYVFLGDPTITPLQGGSVPSTAAVFRVDETGRLLADGTVHAAQFLTGSADIAEWIPVSEPVEPGDVLELNPTDPTTYRLSRDACSPLVAGVVSTEPGVVLGEGASFDQRALLALTGIVPVKVTNEGGPIQPGDLLVTSSTPGHAMLWSGPVPCPCALVGKALEPMTDETGLILVLLTAH